MINALPNNQKMKQNLYLLAYKNGFLVGTKSCSFDSFLSKKKIKTSKMFSFVKSFQNR